MKTILTISLLFLTSTAFCQGIQFDDSPSWSMVIAKAKSENKMIFVDAFTTTCRPCKEMATNIFPQAQVGDFYNSNFINVKMQLDSTAKDNEFVKMWRKDVAAFEAEYKINSYPAYFFLSPDGVPMHFRGSSSSAKDFISLGRDAMDPQKQYFVLRRKYESGDRSEAVLKKLSWAALMSYDLGFFHHIAPEYLLTAEGKLLSKENVIIMANSTSRVTDPGFAVFRDHAAEADAFIGAGFSATMVTGIVTRYIRSFIYPGNVETEQVDWNIASLKLRALVPGGADELLMTLLIANFKQFNNLDHFIHSVNLIKPTSSTALNGYASTVLQNSNDTKQLEKAVEWAKAALQGKKEKNPAFLNTYAILLFKTGKKVEAIKIQEEAYELSGHQPSYGEQLDNMKSKGKI